MAENQTSSDVIVPKPIFDHRINFGQGKTARTLLTEEGCHYPVIHEPYSHRAYYGQPRSPSAPARPRRGDRRMHQTTLTVAKPPWAPDYTTTNNHYFSGSDDLDPVRRPPLCPSMHTSQIKFGGQEEPHHFRSDHMATFHRKEIIPANRLHLMSLVNRVNQTEGAKVREVVKPENGPPSYWSQYNRIHNKLGALRGPGVAREYPVRQQYDVITGEERGPAWKAENTRVSGNRVLHGNRRQLDHKPLLF
ncbi:uncharacterized protein LOC101852406 [Aplysia californica]|uniref:Uncharacterized protein LOC101852406 n=1 Tax=Aplysia californica TaxID=6500 RepID=A0ABM0JP33_APLCA|nr:uncharacterized protein LOC101852406 [Aplysia californica]